MMNITAQITVEHGRRCNPVAVPFETLFLDESGPEPAWILKDQNIRWTVTSDNKIEDGMLWLKPTWLGEWVNTKDLAEYGHDEQVIIKGRADLSLVTDRGRFLSEDIESALRTQLGVDQCLLVPNRTINKFDCYYQGSATETDVVDYIKTICGSTHIINQIKQADIKEDFLGKVSLK